MKSLFLIFNHTITPFQESDARASMGVGRIVSLPDELQQVWRQVPPDLPAISGYLDPVRQWLEEKGRFDDCLLVQGDFGACWFMVQFAFEHQMIPVYATTEREAAEERQPDGIIKTTRHFRHRMFRRYGN